MSGYAGVSDASEWVRSARGESRWDALRACRRAPAAHVHSVEQVEQVEQAGAFGGVGEGVVVVGTGREGQHG